MIYFGGQEVKGQGHMMPKLDLEAWLRHRSQVDFLVVSYVSFSFHEWNK